MTTIDPSGYSEASAHLFTWLADKVLGGAKKAFGWGWTQVEWAKAQDRYDARIIQDYGQIRIFGQTAPKSLKDIFTDVYVLDTPTAYRRFDRAALTEHLWNEDRGLSFRHKERRPGEELLSNGSKFYILGKPGAGKTTFLKYLAVREAQRGRWGQCLGKIPIFVSLKQFGETSQSLFDFIVVEFAVCGFPDAAPFVETLLKSGQALVLFDGLDEVSKTEERDRRGEVTQMLAQFARQYGECHIVVTCRIAAVDYTFEPAFAYLEMADFAPDQVEAFVHTWFWDESDKDKGVALAEGMLAALELPEHKGIRDLSRNPLLLTLLCLNYAETLSFPARRVEIYEEALDALLKKWDSTRRIQRGGLYKTLSLGRKRQMFARVAFDAMTRGDVVMAKADLERRLVEYLANVPELPEAIDIDGEAVLREIVAQHGIFAEQARDLYSFAHLTFQEYFAARHIADSTGSDAIDTLLRHTGDDKWREVFLLTASLLADATTFLVGFDAALQRVVAGRPHLAAWLYWIDECAGASQAAYRRPATRLFYAFALAPTLVSPKNRFLNLTLVCEVNRANDLARALDSDVDSALDLADVTSRALAEIRSHVSEHVEQQQHEALKAAIAALTKPDHKASDDERQRYRAKVLQAIEESEAFTLYRRLWADGNRLRQMKLEVDRYRQLLAEVHAMQHEQLGRWPLKDADLDALVDYLKATRLFYDCLQLAYTPDRRSFEDRIFLPPP